ncbi:MAG TPA: choice-of-anchor D domain-containing protein, partial [Bacteroidetes bacterium]|nr:choice-of-anchor D domain-containing protein [Bacteroidota bacterium]
GTALTAATFTSNPATFNYGQVVLGDSSKQSFTLSNTNGNQSVVITGMNYTGQPDFSDNFPYNLPIVLPAGASITFDIQFVPAALGARVGALEVATTQTGSPLTIPLNGEGISLSPLYRVNAGGPAYTTIGGDPFSADAFSTGGNTSSVGNAIANTVDDVLYQTERWGNFSYNFPVSNAGLYEVRLHFAEIWSGAQSNGVRVFNMALEGNNVLSNYDIFADAGGYTATIKTFQVVVTDGSLDLTVAATANNPKISAIEVFNAGSVPPVNLVANPDPLHFFTQQISTTSAAQDLTLKNTGLTNVDVTGITISGTDAASFAQVFSPPLTLAGGDSVFIPFTFSPVTTGLKSATASIIHSGTNSPLNVTLTGEAVNLVLTVAANIIQVPTCAGSTNGIAHASVSNGLPPYQYRWMPGGQSNDTATGLAEGTYTLRVIDAANDTAFTQLTLVADTLLANVSACRNQNTNQSQAWALATGGLPPYSYLWSSNASNSTNDSIFGLANGSYSITITDANNCTAIGSITIDAATMPCDTCTLPTAWANQDIGAVGAAGDVCYNSPTQEFTVSGSGNDIWATADEFQFVYQTLTGDGEIIARVTSIQNTNQWAKAGVMMRNTLAAGSEEVMMLKRGGNGWSWQNRNTANGTTAFSGNLGGTIFPLWVRIVRLGNSFSGYYSADGISWTQQGTTQTIVMPATIYVGLAVTSHDDGVINTSVLDSVDVIATSIALQASATVTSNYNGADISCAGTADGIATVTPNGGVSPYTYIWDANAANQTTATATNLAAGTYSVTVTDAGNATAVATVTLTEPSAIALNITPSSFNCGYNISCNGAANGSATAFASGGTAPYHFNWGNSFTLR